MSEPDALTAEFFANPGIRLTNHMIQTYVDSGVMSWREQALERSFKTLLARYEESAQLSDDDVGLVVAALSDALSLFADLGGVLAASDATLNEFGDRWFKVTTSHVTRAFRRVLSYDPMLTINRMLSFPSGADLRRRGELDDGDIERLEVIRQASVEHAIPTLRVIGRLFLTYEQLMHSMKHSPATVSSRLMNSPEVEEQSLAIHLRPDLWVGQTREDLPSDGALPVWLSKATVEVWARSVDNAHAFVQCALKNRGAKVQFADEALLPIWLPLPNGDLADEFLLIRAKTFEGKSIANITTEIRSEAEIVDGGWLRGLGMLWDRLAADDWVYDDKLLGRRS